MMLVPGTCRRSCGTACSDQCRIYASVWLWGGRSSRTCGSLPVCTCGGTCSHALYSTNITWTPHPKNQSSSAHLAALLLFPPTGRWLVTAMCEVVGEYLAQLERQIGRPCPGCQEASRDQQRWQGLTADHPLVLVEIWARLTSHQRRRLRVAG